MKELAAELERLAPLDPGELLVDLIGFVKRVGIARAGANRRQPAAQSNRAEAGDRLPACDSERSVRIADPGPVQRVAHDRDLVVARENLVDDRRAEDAVPVDGQIAERRALRPTKEQRKRTL